MFISPSRFTNLGKDFFANVVPKPVLNPRLLHTNLNQLDKMGFGSQIDWLNLINDCSSYGLNSIATVYSGHQFGVYNPKLGDGRALLISDYKISDKAYYELQTKGSGLTPFSRSGDGRAVLRSSIREYIASIAMVSLNVPTTSVAAIIASDTDVYREEVETAAIICRIAPTFIRFGHFEYFSHTEQFDNLRNLLDFTLTNYFNYLESPSYINMLKEIVRLSAFLVAKWQSLGFCHGVMNTDNMSIVGLTLDYGPFAFMDDFRLDYICNHSDYNGRYAYYRQPEVMWWNLQRLADSMLPILTRVELSTALSYYATYYNKYYLEFMGAKLGIVEFNDLDFLHQLISILHNNRVDWTYFWASLSYEELDKNNLSHLYHNDEFISWYKKYQDKLSTQDSQVSICLRKQSNPLLVPRSYLLQRVIEDCKHDSYNSLNHLIEALYRPYEYNYDYADLYQIPDDKNKQIILSCSS